VILLSLKSGTPVTINVTNFCRFYGVKIDNLGVTYISNVIEFLFGTFKIFLIERESFVLSKVQHVYVGFESQLQDFSIVHFDEHPSPSTILPSSHSSKFRIIPSPQTVVQY
jgi:hypothetical protein